MALLDKTIAQHIANKIDWLSQSIESIIPAPLKGKFKGKYKLKVGDWRVIYSFEHSSQIITIYAVRHRREVYKI
jgi:mRNA interferase RelE/StbE